MSLSVAQLRKLNLKQLDELISNAQAVKSEKIPEEKSRAKAALAAMARSKGFSLEEIFGRQRAQSKRRLLPKWRNPSDASQTWSGRGRSPRWFDKRTAVGV